MPGRLLPDFRPAREYPAFRRLLAGGLLSSLGSSMTSFAVVLQVWNLSRSSLAVGLLGLTFVPVLVVGLLGGSAADVMDRRKLALVASVCLMAVSAAFAAQAYAGLGLLWPLYLLATVQVVLQAASDPGPAHVRAAAGAAGPAHRGHRAEHTVGPDHHAVRPGAGRPDRRRMGTKDLLRR
jgi:MFS family permease